MRNAARIICACMGSNRSAPFQQNFTSMSPNHPLSPHSASDYRVESTGLRNAILVSLDEK